MAATSSGKELLKRLIPTAKVTLQEILEQQRTTFWGDTQLKLRVRKYPKSGEERVSIVKPQLSTVKLYSQILKKHVPVKITPEMLRTVESKGGLDEYLLNTADRKLHSDVASGLRWQIMCKMKQEQMSQVRPGSTSSSRATGGSTSSITANSGSTSSGRADSGSTSSSRADNASNSSSRADNASNSSSRANNGSNSSSRADSGSTSSSRADNASNSSSRANNGSNSSSRANSGSNKSSTTGSL